MKFMIHPAVDEARLQKIVNAAGEMEVLNVAEVDRALADIVDADAFFGKMTPTLLTAAQNLKWVQSPTASLEHYLFPELIAHPSMLSNMRGLFSDVIADHVMGFVICLARNFKKYILNQQVGLWEPVAASKKDDANEAPNIDFTMGPACVSPIDSSHLHLADCTLGVVGVGYIGQEICRRAAAFGMTVIGVDPICRQVENVVDDVWDVDALPQLLEQADFVVIAAPHTPQTEGLFRREQFQKMKSTGYLINIGRGAIVCLDDLTWALDQGEISGVALDVTEVEPLPSEHRLWTMENVLITPHVAAASPRIAERHLETLLENVRRFSRGEKPTTLVDKQCWF